MPVFGLPLGVLSNDQRPEAFVKGNDSIEHCPSFTDAYSRGCSTFSPYLISLAIG